MPNKSHSDPAQDSALIPTGDDIYNNLMGAIEPDLLTTNISLLDEKYKGETKEERQARLERYRQAYNEYDKVYERWITDFTSAVTQFKRDALHSAEADAKTEDQKDLDALETQIEQSSTTAS